MIIVFSTSPLISCKRVACCWNCFEMGFVRWNGLLGWPSIQPTNQLHHLQTLIEIKLIELNKKSGKIQQSTHHYHNVKSVLSKIGVIVLSPRIFISFTKIDDSHKFWKSSSVLSILLMSSPDSVQKLRQNAARNDLLILQTSLRIFAAPGFASVQYT